MPARRLLPPFRHSIFARALHEQRRALAGWCAGLAVYSALMLLLFPTVRGNQGIKDLLDTYPKAFRSMFSVSDFTTGTGYLRGEIFSVMAPLLIVVLAVLWGSDVTAGEEERGTIDILLANPISRRRVVIEKWAAVVFGTALVSAVLFAVLAAGGPLVRLQVAEVDLLSTVVSTALLGAVFGTLALAIAAATGRRGLARGVSAALAVASYLVSSLADLVPWLGKIQPLSPWYHAMGVDPLTRGLSWHLLVLVGLTAALAMASVVTFERRDLAVS